MSVEIAKIPAPPAVLGECPLWSMAEQSLYWVDIESRFVHRYEPATGSLDSRRTPGRPGSIALTSESGRLLVAMEHQICWLMWATGELTTWIDLDAPGTGNRLNDGRCDPAGRFVVGSMFADIGQSQKTGTLYQVASSGDSNILRTGIGISNGLAFDAERHRMYFADSPTATVLVFDYDPESGRCGNPREFFDYNKIPGWPDGACVDADGCYWSASVFGWAIVRITPDGRLDRRIELPIERPTMPCFGGSNLSTLYVTSISGEPVTDSKSTDNASEPTDSAPKSTDSAFTPGDTLVIEPNTQGILDVAFKLSD